MFDPWVGKISLEEAWQSTLVFLPGESHQLKRNENMKIYKLERSSSLFAWKVPWMEEPGRLQSMGLQRVGFYFTFPGKHSYQRQ